jgi:hypothetical protein
MLASMVLAGCSDNVEGTLVSRYAQHCAEPRRGADPMTGIVHHDTQGSLLDEKHWVRAWIDDVYLWYREVPDADITQFSTAVDTFNARSRPVQRCPSSAFRACSS